MEPGCSAERGALGCGRAGLQQAVVPGNVHARLEKGLCPASNSTSPQAYCNWYKRNVVQVTSPPAAFKQQPSGQQQPSGGLSPQAASSTLQPTGTTSCPVGQHRQGPKTQQLRHGPHRSSPTARHTTPQLHSALGTRPAKRSQECALNRIARTKPVGTDDRQGPACSAAKQASHWHAVAHSPASGPLTPRASPLPGPA
jgi:hypothetical protein